MTHKTFFIDMVNQDRKPFSQKTHSFIKKYTPVRGQNKSVTISDNRSIVLYNPYWHQESLQRYKSKLNKLNTLTVIHQRIQRIIKSVLPGATMLLLLLMYFAKVSQFLLF